MRLANVQDDSIEPGSELRLPVESEEASIGSLEGFQTRGLCRIGVASEPERQSVGLFAVPIEQDLKRRLISVLNGLDPSKIVVHLASAIVF